MVKIAVVILNWNGRLHLEQFLPSVVKNSLNEAEIIVVDNASTDDSIEFLKNNYPDVRLLINKSNGGFAKGYNEGLKKIEAEYFILLNSDVEVSPGWIRPVIDLMDSDKMIAACQPKIKSFNQRDFFEHAGASGGFLDIFSYPFCRGRVFFDVEKDEGQYDDQREIFWATGACMFVRSSAFREAGGFDDAYFAHMEEIDLCWRMKLLGYKIMAVPQSTVYHVGGGTLSYKSPQKTFLNFRNSLYTLYKNSRSPFLFLIILLRLVLDGIAGLKFLLEGHASHMQAVINAHFSFYRNLGELKKKKRLIKRTSPNLTGLYNGSVVLAFYLGRKKHFSEIDN